MNLLFVCQHYYPEPFNSTEICERLVEAGHEVTVLTGYPNVGLPGGKVPAEYKKPVDSRKGVSVLRVPLVPRGEGVVNRILNYVSFWRNSRKAIGRIGSDFDAVIGYQLSPIMQVDCCALLKRREGVPFLLHCLDLWPDSLQAGGISKSSFAYRLMKKISRRIYASADVIAISSKSFEGYFKEELNLTPKWMVYLPQYAEDLFLQSVEAGQDGYDPDKFNLTFAGNIGTAQSPMTILKAAELLLPNDRIRFHFVGSGSELSSCMDYAASRNLVNVVFHGRRPLWEMPSVYASSSAMLVTLDDCDYLSRTVPRKLQSCMAAGRPIVAAANGEVAEVVASSGCGVSCGAGDVEALASACLRLANATRDELDGMGLSASRFYREHYSKDLFYERLEKTLSDMVG